MSNLVLFNDVLNRKLITGPGSGQPFALPPLAQFETVPFEIYHLYPTGIQSPLYTFLDYTAANAFKIGIGNPGKQVAAYTDSFTATTAPIITITRLVSGTTGVNEQQLITISSPLVYGGYATFASGSNPSPQLFYNSASPFFAPADLQACLTSISSVGTNNIQVQQLTAQSYLVIFIGAKAGAPQTLLSGDGSNLIAPRGMIGALNLATDQIADLFGNNSQVQTRFEIEVDLVSGSPMKTLQTTVSLIEAVISDETIIPPDVISSYATTVSVLSSLAALRSSGTLSVSAAGASILTIPAGCMLYTDEVTVGAGSGVYTASQQLASTGRQGGDKVFLSLSMPASTNPIFQIKNAAGTVIFEADGTGVATSPPIFRTFTFGTDWTLDG